MANMKRTALRSRQGGASLWLILAVMAAVLGAAVWKYKSDQAGKLAGASPVVGQEAASGDRVRAERQSLESNKARTEQQQADALAVAYRQFADLQGRWRDALRVAGATPRMALSGPVAALQALRREAEALQAPECLRLAKDHLMRSMSASIEAMLLFMTDSKDSQFLVRVALMDQAETAMKDANADRATCPQI